MKWPEYVSNFEAKEDPVFSGLNFTFPGVTHHEPSFFIRLNNELLTDFSLLENDKIIFSYPASRQFVLSLVVFKILKDVLSGYSAKLSEVSIAEIHPGEKFYLGSAICYLQGFSFIGDPKDGRHVDFGIPDPKKPCIRHILESNFPKVVKAPDSAAISKFSVFDKEYNNFFHKRPSDESASSESVVDRLSSLMASQGSSTILVTKLKDAQEMLSQSSIEGRQLLDVFSVKKANYFGKTEWIGRTRGPANPELIIAPDINAVKEFLQSDAKTKVSTVFVDANYNLNIAACLQPIGDLLDLHTNMVFFFPENITCDASPLIELGFKVFQWNNSMVSPDLVEINTKLGSHLLKRVSTREIKPLFAADKSAMNAYELLSHHRDSIEVECAEICDCYYSLMQLSYRVIRMVSPLPANESQNLIDANDARLKSVFSSRSITQFLKDPSIQNDFTNAWAAIKACLTERRSPKEQALIDYLSGQHHHGQETIALIVDGQSDSKKIQGHLSDVLFQENIDNLSIDVFTPDEFLDSSIDFDLVLVSGWLKRETMKNIIFSNLGSVYSPILYSNEIPWMFFAVDQWNKEIVSSNINDLDPEIDQIPSAPLNLTIAETKVINKPAQSEDYDDISKRDDDVRYRSFRSDEPTDQKVEAVPAGFSDGSYGVFTEFNRFICLTQMANGQADEIALKTISELRIGDIVLFRDSPNDIIKTMADLILEESGLPNARAVANSWRDLLMMDKLAGSSDQDIIDKLVAFGLKKSKCEIRNWLNDDYIICPNSKEDLTAIAKALHDEENGSWIDDALKNATIVRAAHQKAGRQITKLLLESPDFGDKVKSLSSQITSSIQSSSVEIEKIGKVYLLKVVDIGQPSNYSRSQVNKRRQ